MAKKGNDSVGGAIGAVLFGIVVIIAMIPKPVWIALGITAAAAVLCWVIYKSILAYERTRAAAEEQARIEQAAQAAAAKRARAEQLRREKQQRIDAVGRKHADLIDLAWVNVKKVGASEAARAGWLGDVDFSADIAGVTDSFEKAHALRKVTEQLATLDKPRTAGFSPRPPRPPPLSNAAPSAASTSSSGARKKRHWSTSRYSRTVKTPAPPNNAPSCTDS